MSRIYYIIRKLPFKNPSVYNVLNSIWETIEEFSNLEVSKLPLLLCAFVEGATKGKSKIEKSHHKKVSSN